MPAPKTKPSPKPTPAEIELHPDAWARFERAIGRMGDAPPSPHVPASGAGKPKAKRSGEPAAKLSRVTSGRKGKP